MLELDEVLALSDMSSVEEDLLALKVMEMVRRDLEGGEENAGMFEG